MAGRTHGDRIEDLEKLLATLNARVEELDRWVERFNLRFSELETDRRNLAVLDERLTHFARNEEVRSQRRWAVVAALIAGPLGAAIAVVIQRLIAE